MTSIEDGEFVDIHGLPQWVTIRGRDAANPPLMILPGAGGWLSIMGPFFAPWEQAFTLVQWDQPGTGWTLARSGAEATGPLSFDRLARDGLAVVDHVRARLGARRIGLLALSMGGCVGLRMLKTSPERFYAYAANGQVTDWAAQERASYARILAKARRDADAEAAQALERIGPPPWADIADDAVRGQYANAFTPAELAAYPPEVRAALYAQGAAPHVPANLAPPDPRAAAMAAFVALKPQLAAFDAAALGLDYAVPLAFLQGKEDDHTPAAEVRAFAERLRAPSVTVDLIEGGGHMSWLMRDVMLELLLRRVRPFAA
jgi:pimeloyl-ACP methyl ester carboxylesterase